MDRVCEGDRGVLSGFETLFLCGGQALHPGVLCFIRWLIALSAVSA
jgi:hypothetical protein